MKRRRLFESLENRQLLATDVFASAGGQSLNVMLDGSELVVVGSTSGELLRQESSTIDSLRVVGSDGDDTLVLDYSGGFIGTPIAFEGGGQSTTAGDSIELLGGDIDGAAADSITHTFINENDGSIAIDVGGVVATIDYTGLEPVVDNLNAVNRVFTFTGGDETITLSDDGGAGDNINRIDSTLGESVLFVSPTNSLTVNAGTGTDAIVVSTLDTLYAASLIIDGGASATDTLTTTNLDLINTPGRGLTLSGLESIDITGGTIDGNTAVIGGGLLINNSPDATTLATLDGVIIQNNAATGGAAPNEGGGGLYNNGATLVIRGGTRIESNTAIAGAGSGGGIFNAGILTVTDSFINDNQANRAGGGIETVAGTTTTLTDVVLNRNNAGVVPAVGAPGNGGGLHVTGDGNVTIVRGTVNENVSASEGGGLWNGSGTMTIAGTTIEDNTASGNAADNGGGGIFNDAGTLDIDNATIEGNQADGVSGSGGGVFSLAGIVTIDNTTIENNSANRAGGGVEIVEGTMTLTGVDLLNNDVDGGGTTATTPNPGNGGGLHVTGLAGVTFSGGLVQGNIAREEGGGLWNSSNGTMLVNATTIDSNIARSANNAGNDQGGGGVFNNGGTLTIENNASITNNEAIDNNGNGGGVMTVGGILIIDNTTIANNRAARAGGGIENNAGTTTLTDVTVGGVAVADGNVAGINGGGLHASGGASLTTVNGGVFQNNVADEEGGGLWVGGGSLTINNTLITENTANSGSNAGNDQGGGGVFNINGTLDINSAIITNNVATASNGNGGGVMTVGGTVTIDDSSIQGNQAGRAGGGIENNNGVVTITNETVGGAAVASGNTAVVNGGGLHASGAASVTTVNGGLFQNNVAGEEGGGLWNGAGELNINGTTITQNTANSGVNAGNDQGGGGVFNIGGTLNIDNAVISQNVATAGNGNGGGVMTVGGTVTIDDTMIQANQATRAGGGIENNAGNVTLTGVTVGGANVGDGNTTGVNGGGLHASGAGVTVVDGGSFENNVAGEEGGGLWNGPGSMTIRNNTVITQNTANSASNAGNDQGGGGVFNIGGTLDIDDATITSNSATANGGNGGGVMTVNGTVTIDDTFIGSNASGRDGGGLHASGASDVTVTGGAVQANVAPQEGGGLWNGAGTLRIDTTTITENTAGSSSNAGNDQGGGGVFNNGGTLDIDDATITNNLATANNGNGGGVMTVGGTVTVDGGSIANNDAGRAGGGLENNAGNVTLTGVAVGGPTVSDGNTASVNGGGLHAQGGTTVINDGSVQNNIAAEEGGGLWNASGNMTVTGTDIDSNRANGAGAQQGGGGAFNESGALRLINVQLTNNIANTGLASGGGAFNHLGEMHVSDSVITGNDKCGLSYFRPEGSISNNTFANNVGGNLCPLLGTNGDDTILVTNNAISINADTLLYDDDTLGPITILSGLGNDTFNIQSTDVDNPIIADGGEGTDTFNVSSDAPTNLGSLDGILGDINIIGGSHADLTQASESVTARRAPPNDSETVVASTFNGDRLFVSDEASVADNTYQLNATTFQRTQVMPTGVITYSTVETLEIETGQGNDTVNISTTVIDNQVSIDTNAGADDVTVQTTGADSILRLNTESGGDNVEIQTTGNRSVVIVDTADQGDFVTILNRGTASGIDVSTGQGADTVTLGGVTAPPTTQTNLQSLIHVSGGSGGDVFDVNEVFYETIVELEGDADNDTFNLNADGADAAGFLGRINDDPINAVGQDDQARTRELLIDGGGNAATLRNFTEGINIGAGQQATETQVFNQDVGDRINVNAQTATTPLDLRYVITGQGTGVLATTMPAQSQDTRATIGNEVLDSVDVETIQINSGSADDILTISSEIAFGIAGSDQAIRWDAGGGDNDRLEIVGTSNNDRITVGNLTGDATLEPIETDNVEFVRIDGLDGDDQISLQTDANGVLNGGEGDDVLLGGTAKDALAGGPGVDLLFGRGGNDVLFSDRNFGSDENFDADGELLDGGDQDNLMPGDICVQRGLDLVRNCEVLVDGGAIKDVLTWLRAQVVADSTISFEGDNEQLQIFGPVKDPGIPLFATTEASSLSPTGALPGGGTTGGSEPVVPQRGEGEVIYDVNRDGRVTALDALRIINRMNAQDAAGESTSGSLATSSGLSDEDVNADGMVSALDALMVINLLNASESEGEPAPVSATWQSAVDGVFGANGQSDEDEALLVDSESNLF
ncbi:dockerin type I domain-containing protein [Aporhodopirellula aestuarii]|uniref:Dockerin type I domain-containing protein n=1 Tax=Aporhodopirellula aestuarii TaxID=2950107 RepID=A0ABT0U3Y0_9BACT|nr:dockerin type I domain-containing protein [Aporhodopirellula aestuarii]MCM2371630.1 dockerin type I domain-containing protein [Aporhodopirellula aestuarii]